MTTRMPSKAASNISLWATVLLVVSLAIIGGRFLFVVATPEASPSQDARTPSSLLECRSDEMTTAHEISYATTSGRPAEPRGALDAMLDAERLEGIQRDDFRLVREDDEEVAFAVTERDRQQAIFIAREIDDGWAITEWHACGSWELEYLSDPEE